MTDDSKKEAGSYSTQPDTNALKKIRYAFRNIIALVPDQRDLPVTDFVEKEILLRFR